MERNLIIGIIGLRGRYGQWLERVFKQMGYPVIGSDILESHLSNRDVVERSDVVIFSVPPRVTCEVIEQVVPYARPTQFWFDVTSLKELQVESMLKSEANVVGLHPMCAPPTTNLHGQTVVTCLTEPCSDWWNAWMLEVLTRLQAKVKMANPVDHDLMMAFVQAMPHFNQMASAAVLREIGVDVADSLTYTSPFYRISQSLMGRLLRQDPELYCDIQMCNPATVKVLDAFVQAVQHLYEIVKSGDRDSFINEFTASREHFTAPVIQDGYDLFQDLNRIVADWSHEYKVTLEATQDLPGLLVQPLTILSETGVNLTSIFSYPSGSGFRFRLGLQQNTESAEVQSAMDRISQSTELTIIKGS
ncbi:MAG: prephenate dehydrogenase/arogenate dehydrogenase family protein [bacterium]|nr:prephenate dehydrogenase/arogenate dehydrogenase family protein [bacterium]